MILVTGASGKLGSLVVEHLLGNGLKNEIVAFTRNAGKANEYKARGIKTRIGDFDKPEGLEKAFEGIEKMLLISTLDHSRYAQQSRVIDAAKRAGVKHIAYTGVAMRDVESSVLKPLMKSHFDTENYLKASGLHYTFLRNSLYMEMIPLYIGNKVFDKGIYLPAGDGKVSFALRSEMAEAAAKVLSGNGHENMTYDVTGGAGYSFRDIAGTLSELSRKEINYTDAPTEGFDELLKAAGVPGMYVTIVAGFAADIKAHQYEVVSSDLENLIGRRPATLKESLQKIYNL